MNDDHQISTSNSDQATVEYVGFWLRVLASLFDTLLIIIMLVPIIIGVSSLLGLSYVAFVYETSTLSIIVQYVLPAIVVILFWVVKSATPGKSLIGAKIVDADSGTQPSTGQFVGRYLGYYIATIPLFLGLLWVGWDRRKQGWHDKLAGTVVVRGK